jgi:lipid-A-disaccharide synthase
MKKKIFIVAGEASGDYLAAKVIEKLDPNLFDIKAVGGPLMAKAGAKILEDYSILAIMGLAELVTKIFSLWWFLKKIIKVVKEFEPDLLITIDSPGFNFRLVRACKGKFPALHYVAPSVWAYKPERAKIVEDLYQTILLLFPFEVPYFSSMSHFVVGPSLLEEELIISSISEEERLAREDSDEIKICLLPGSREVEIKRHLPILLSAAEKMLIKFQDKVTFTLLTLPELEKTLTKLLETSPIKDKILLSSKRASNKKIREESSLAWVKSGTGTLDFLGATVPAITFYKVSPITFWFMKGKIKISHFNLVNIINNSNILPELIQDNFTADNLYNLTLELLDKKRKESIIKAYYKAYNLIAQEEKPSHKAAKIIKNLCK